MDDPTPAAGVAWATEVESKQAAAQRYLQEAQDGKSKAEQEAADLSIQLQDAKAQIVKLQADLAEANETAQQARQMAHETRLELEALMKKDGLL